MKSNDDRTDILASYDANGKKGWSCSMCSYYSHKMYHARMHHQRIHVMGGRPNPNKRKFNDFACDKPNVRQPIVRQPIAKDRKRPSVQHVQEQNFIGPHVCTESVYRARMRVEKEVRRVRKQTNKKTTGYAAQLQQDTSALSGALTPPPNAALMLTQPNDLEAGSNSPAASSVQADNKMKTHLQFIRANSATANEVLRENCIRRQIFGVSGETGSVMPTKEGPSTTKELTHSVTIRHNCLRNHTTKNTTDSPSAPLHCNVLSFGAVGIQWL